MPVLRSRDTIQDRSSEMTTDVVDTPTLVVVSPTPRTFTFPSFHNLTHSPHSTPSTTPFEPDLSSLASSLNSTPFTTPSPIMRTLTPESPEYHLRQMSSSPAYSSSDDVERHPKKGDKDYIKRPENAFILFRRKYCEEREANATANGEKKKRQADLSKSVSQLWQALSADEKKYWKDLALEKKKEHARMFPNYVYRPQRVRDKDGKSYNKKRTKHKNELLGVPSSSRLHGRSTSAPTPPPSFHPISLPSLLPPSSCPSSPSLVPMISRHAAHLGNPEDIMNVFDYQPSGSVYLSPPEYTPYISRPFVDSTMSSSPASSPASATSELTTPDSSWAQSSTFHSNFAYQSTDELTFSSDWPSSELHLNLLVDKSYPPESYTNELQPEYVDEEFLQFPMDTMDLDPSFIPQLTEILYAQQPQTY